MLEGDNAYYCEACGGLESALKGKHGTSTTQTFIALILSLPSHLFFSPLPSPPPSPHPRPRPRPHPGTRLLSLPTVLCIGLKRFDFDFNTLSRVKLHHAVRPQPDPSSPNPASPTDTVRH